VRFAFVVCIGMPHLDVGLARRHQQRAEKMKLPRHVRNQHIHSMKIGKGNFPVQG
jgi:hypothetical protein